MEPNDSQTHNLFLHKFIDNKQSKFVHLTKLDTHKLIYRNGMQHKYLTNLIILGNNFIQLYAIFNTNLILDLGISTLYEDIKSVCLWDKNIVLVSNKKVVGLVYEEHMLKNSFMLSLQCLQTAEYQKVECVCDKNGYYMGVSTNRELLICVSQKAIQKHKVKPFYQKGLKIIEEDVKWNRVQYQSIAQVIRLDFYDYEFAKVESLYFSDEKLYFVAYSSKNNFEKGLFFIMIDGIFSDKNDQSLITMVSQQKPSTQQIYIIPRGNQTQYLIFKDDKTIQLESRQKGQVIESQFSKDKKIRILSKHHHSIFPLQILSENTIFIYERLGNGSFQKKTHVLPEHIIEADIRENLIVYSNNYEVGIINNNLPNSQQPKVIWKSFGNIIDFSIGLNTLIVDNYHGNLCRIYQIKKGIMIDETPFATHMKKRALESMQGLQQIKSLQDSDYILCKFKNSSVQTLYSFLSQQIKEQMQGIHWNGSVEIDEKKYIILWTKKLTLFTLRDEKLQLFKAINVQWKNSKVKIIEELMILQKNLNFTFISLKDENKRFDLKISTKEQPISVHLLKKIFTFKKKDKDYLFLEAFVFYENAFQIWEICVFSQDCKLSHRTQHIAEGLPFLFNSPSKENCLRSLTCPQYILSHHSEMQKMSLKKVHIVDDGTLMMVNCKNELFVYRKQYCSSIQVGYIYRKIILPLSIFKKFKYQDNITFTDIGRQVFRISNYAYYKEAILQIPESIKTIFEMEGETWTMENDGKIHKLVTKGQVISNMLTVPIESSLKSNIIGIQVTNQNFIIYSPSGFEIYNKSLKLKWTSDLSPKEKIINICAYEHFIAMSYYNYCEDSENVEDYQSIKFKFRIYNIITKAKVIEKEKALEEPALYIRYIPTDKLILVSPSTIFIYSIKNQQTLQTIRNKNYSKRTLLSSFSYIPEKVNVNPECMIFGGSYGGLSFMGYWSDKEKLEEIWFQNIQCQIREMQLFRYEPLRNDYELKALVADQDSNLVIFNIKINKAEKLADIHINSKINSIKKRFEMKNQVLYMGCTDGCLRVLTPIKLKDIDISFLDFQECIKKQIPFLAGFNTCDSRRLYQKHRTYKITSRGNIVDGDLVTDFTNNTETLKNYIYEKTDLSVEDMKNQLLKMI